MKLIDDTLEERCKDPEFCRALLAELKEIIKENEQMRNELKELREGL